MGKLRLETHAVESLNPPPMGLFSLLFVVSLIYLGWSGLIMLSSLMVPSPIAILIFAASLILSVVAEWVFYILKRWKLSLLSVFVPIIELGVMALLPST